MGSHADDDGDDLELASTTLPDDVPMGQGAGGTLAPGVVLNATYALERRLGEGGMGEVWQAKHLRLPKSVAIKVLLPSLEASAEVLERFKREAEIGATLAHPNIVHVFDFNELEDGRKYIAMELLEGESLSDRLERGAFPYAEVAEILAQAGLGLRVAHDAGVVHRDLKPDNLFLSSEPNSDPPYRVKILDFGISKIQRAEAALTRDMTVMGTPAYMAPEQAMGYTNKLGPKADQFALATIAYEMLTGQVAFRGNTLAEIVYRVVQETPAPIETLVPGVPARCGRAISKAMAKEPDERFADVSAFVEAFRDEGGEVGLADVATAVVGEPPPVAAAASAAPASRGGARRWWMAGAAVALVVGAVAAVSGSGGGDAPATPDDDEGTGVATPAGETTGARPPDSLPTSDDGAGADDPPASPGAVDTPSSREDLGAEENETDGAGARTAGTKRRGANDAQQPAARDPEARTLLDEANAALAAGKSRRAQQLAERSYRVQSSREALEVMAKAACQQRNLGLVNARLARLPRASRRRIAQYCREYGLSPE